jgi:hypothetical protein
MKYNDNKIIIIGHSFGSIFTIYLYIILVYILKKSNIYAYTFGGFPVFPIHLIEDIDKKDNFNFIVNDADITFHMQSEKTIGVDTSAEWITDIKSWVGLSNNSSRPRSKTNMRGLPKTIYFLSDLDQYKSIFKVDYKEHKIKIDKFLFLGRFILSFQDVHNNYWITIPQILQPLKGFEEFETLIDKYNDDIDTRKITHPKYKFSFAKMLTN